MHQSFDYEKKLNFIWLVCLFQFESRIIDGKGDWFSIEYPSFWIDSETNFYSIHLGSGGIGDVDDALFQQNGKNFSTYDQDHDGQPWSNCAEMNSGGWWYSGCGPSVLIPTIYPGPLPVGSDFSSLE